jgi:trehalose 6-phosphate phosphatase
MISPMIDPFDHLDRIAFAPVLLVASDYDGTLAPIVTDPKRAFPHRETLVAVKKLASLPNTHVALISGRSLQDLSALTGSPSAVRMIGSHGSEFDVGFARTLPPPTVELLGRVTAEIEAIAGRAEGVIVETKPASVAFHYRNVSSAEIAAELLDAVLHGPGAHPGVYVRRGKMVVELSVMATDKGAALDDIRTQTGASVAVYLGDDVTDEDAFKVLRGPDLAVKVGEGESSAKARLNDTAEVARFLAALAERRGAWLAGSHSAPIERHSLLSDQRTVALLTDGARLTWFCAPRIDSAAIFAELVGGPTGGYFSVDAHDGSLPIGQEYGADSMILTTSWPTFRLVDYLDCSGDRPMQRPGRTDLIRVLQGEGEVRIEFAPRLDFGRTATQLRGVPNGLLVEDSPEPMVLRSPGVDWNIETIGLHHTAYASVSLSEKPLVLELRYGTRSTDAIPLRESERRRQTRRHWAQWASELQLPKDYEEPVRRSALILKSLCHGPSGGIAAAATTSLPESLGGVRNWDYRYSWLRDAAMTADALAHLGSLSEGLRFVDWLLGVLDKTTRHDFMRPVYSISGEELGIEAEIAELSGYAGSRPVRIGNSAARQLQLDVYGPLLDLLLNLLRRGAPLSAEHWRLVADSVSAVSDRWREPDHGIWEVRGPKRHFVHSKVMCWVAVDRALQIGHLLQIPERAEWGRLAEEIATELLEKGWKESVGSFAAAYDGTDLDAAALYVGLSGLVPPDDPRFAGTVNAVERYLRDDGVVYRYRYDDGLPGTEGGFLICTSWLIDSYLLLGRIDDARELFSQLSAQSGPTGLFPEEFDPKRNISLGNIPQAYSHLGFIRNALHLGERP